MIGDTRKVYQCSICGKIKYVDPKYALSERTLICCGVAMIIKSRGVIRKPLSNYVKK